MKYINKNFLMRCVVSVAILLSANDMIAQDAKQSGTSDVVHYSGTRLSNPSRHDGGLSPVVGVHNIQIMKARRTGENVLTQWTYNHQPMMAYWGGRFWVHYLSDVRDEQVPPSRTLLLSSEDGYHWSEPQILFPEYNVPEGFKKEGVAGEAHNMKAVMHQRMGFYVSKSGKLLAVGAYGICLNKKDHNNDGNGIGRVVREIHKDGSLGKIYFVYYNHGFNEKNTDFPNYRKASKGVREACEEMLNNPRVWMQWVEEADRGDIHIPLSNNKGGDDVFKAYNDYTLDDGRLVALWKHALTSISSDGGRTWTTPVERAPGFVNSNAKIWGQRLSDGTFATIYNPSEFRWPLAISLSSDGLNYTTLNTVCGEVAPMRYGGNYKSFGPQYVRGIQEGNGEPADGNMWLTYSMNKEDMWVARVPVPVLTKAVGHANDDFSQMKSLSELLTWNVYSPQDAPVSLDGCWLKLEDADRHDYARVERKIPASKELTVEFQLQAAQNDFGWLEIAFMDDHSTTCSRIDITNEGLMRCKGGARYGTLVKQLEPNKTYEMKVVLSVKNRKAIVFIDGKKCGERMFFAPVESIERVSFRTGPERSYPTIDTPADWDGELEDADATERRAVFRIANFKTSAADADAGALLLKDADYKHWVDKFNTMEDENIVQAIPNAQAWQWMQENVPLFDCELKDFEEMYYYRWWTLRKHIKEGERSKEERGERKEEGDYQNSQTEDNLKPQTYCMTEFLVERSYADKWNLISSALGHHVHESRWLRNPMWLDDILYTWYYGNDGKPMNKLDKYSSWTAASVWGRYLVDGRKEWLLSMKERLEGEYDFWEHTHRWKENGRWTLYFQADVQDAMEESISGGRKKRYARPSINSYMFGNARALQNIARLDGDEASERLFKARADSIKEMVEIRLWNSRHGFFETLRPDSSANVREAIGFIPWYFNLPDDNDKFGSAWLQAADEQGFSAPYGQTTAERRHPQFRSHGVGKCEWDGAVWPFATSQTLTAMANYINNYSAPTVGDSLFFAEMKKYVESQSHRGRPYIGEYLDETTGYWLKGDQERSRYYNHSTFCDLIITGIVGLRPQEGNDVLVNPLIPEDKCRWFCLDNVAYHGHTLCIMWDKDGSRYHAGKGLHVYVDGHRVGHNEKLGKTICENVL